MYNKCKKYFFHWYPFFDANRKNGALSNLISETFVYGYGSNENGELGLDYNPQRINNYYHAWTPIPLNYIVQPNTIFPKRLNFRVYDVYYGDKFSLISVIYQNGSIGLYWFMLRKDDKFSLLIKLKIICIICFLFLFQINPERLKLEMLNGELEDEGKKRCIHIEKFNALHNVGIKDVAVFGDRILIIFHCFLILK